MRVKGRVHGAHRVAYEVSVGPIPEGLEIDHLCFNPPCVNTAHLEPVPHSENMARANARYRARGERWPHGCRIRPTCDRGHAWTDVYMPADGRRRCRICMRERQHRNRAQQAAA